MSDEAIELLPALREAINEGAGDLAQRVVIAIQRQHVENYGSGSVSC